MRFEILKIIGSVIGVILSLKFIFWLFAPSEIWTIIFVYILIMITYGIQVTEWIEEENLSLFKFDIYNSRKVYQQYRIFGIIPISKKQSLRTDDSFLKDLDPYVMLPVAKTAISVLPFGTLMSKVGKN